MTHPESTHPYSTIDESGDIDSYRIAVETRGDEDDQPIKVYLPWRVIHSPSLKMDLYNGPAKLASYSLEEMREKLRKLLASTYGDILVREVDSQK